MKKITAYLLQGALVAGCLVYVFAGVDLGKVVEHLCTFDVLGLAVVLAVVVLSFVVMGLRLVALAPRPIPPATGIAASLLCVGLNNILPARLGEVAKGLHLHRNTGIRIRELMVMVMVERLLDIIVLLCLGVVAASLLGHRIIGPILPTALAAGLTLLILAVRIPALGQRLINLMPTHRLRDFLAGALEALQAYSSPRRLALPILLTLGMWGMGLAILALVILWLAGLPLTPSQVLLVFTASMAGIAVPGAPGGLGVYEGAVVASLGWFGMSKDEALAVAVVMRAYNTLPAVIGAAWTLWRSDLRLDKLWKKNDVSITKPENPL